MTEPINMKKCGRGEDVCCYVDGKHCPHLRPSNREGWRWDCGLRADLGSWDAVHASEEYQRDVKPTWERLGVADCGDWTPERPCPDCGAGT